MNDRAAHILSRRVRPALVGFLVTALVLVAAPAAAPAGGYLVTDVWGHGGGEPGDLGIPKGIAVGADGSVYVADYGRHCVDRFSPAGELIAAWGTMGTGPGQFLHPSRLAIGPDGTVYVTDSDNHRVQCFSADGTLLRVWGRHGRRAGELARPRGIAIGPDGLVYLTEEGNDRVQVFTPRGRFVRMWGGPGTGRGRFDHPKDVAVGPDGRVYVIDTHNDRVQVFTPRGRCVRLLGGLGTAPGRFLKPRGVMVDDRGHVFVADSLNHRLQEFDHAGSFVRQWGCFGRLPGMFDHPRDMASAPDGTLVVTDTSNRRIQRFVLSPLEDSAAPLTTATALSGWSREPVEIALAATDADGAVAATYVRVGRVAVFAPYAAAFTMDQQGVTPLQYLSVDAAGNQETTRTRVLRLDWTEPGVRPQTLPDTVVPRGGTLSLRVIVSDNVSPTCGLALRIYADEELVQTIGLGTRATPAGGRQYLLRAHIDLAAGRYEARLSARDPAGNAGVATGSLRVR